MRRETVAAGLVAVSLLLSTCGASSGPAARLTAPTTTPPSPSPTNTTTPTVAAKATPVPTTAATVSATTDTITPTALSGMARGPVLPDVKDFEIVMYQGEKALGGESTSFERAFEQGRPVVLNFWAGKCPPCRAEMPGFQDVSARYQDEVLFLGIDIGTFTGLGTQEDARKLLKDLRVRYPSGYAVDPTPLVAYRIRTMPTTLFFSAEGKLIYRHTGELSEADLGALVMQLAAAS